jgi:hypothetical protein
MPTASGDLNKDIAITVQVPGRRMSTVINVNSEDLLHLQYALLNHAPLCIALLSPSRYNISLHILPPRTIESHEGPRGGGDASAIAHNVDELRGQFSLRRIRTRD